MKKENPKNTPKLDPKKEELQFKIEHFGKKIDQRNRGGYDFYADKIITAFEKSSDELKNDKEIVLDAKERYLSWSVRNFRVTKIWYFVLFQIMAGP